MSLTTNNPPKSHLKFKIVWGIVIFLILLACYAVFDGAPDNNSNSGGPVPTLNSP